MSTQKRACSSPSTLSLATRPLLTRSDGSRYTFYITTIEIVFLFIDSEDEEPSYSLNYCTGADDQPFHESKVGQFPLPVLPDIYLSLSPPPKHRDPHVMAHTGKTDPVEVMAALREEKNNFKPKL